jgi:hypothetical protein
VSRSPVRSSDGTKRSERAYSDLLRARDGAEDNLRKASLGKGPVGDAADDLQPVFDDGHRDVLAVENEAGNVLAGHLGELALEDVLETHKDDEVLRGRVLACHASEVDVARVLLDDGGSLARQRGLCKKASDPGCL